VGRVTAYGVHPSDNPRTPFAVALFLLPSYRQFYPVHCERAQRKSVGKTKRRVSLLAGRFWIAFCVGVFSCLLSVRPTCCCEISSCKLQYHRCSSGVVCLFLRLLVSACFAAKAARNPHRPVRCANPPPPRRGPVACPRFGTGPKEL